MFSVQVVTELTSMLIGQVDVKMFSVYEHVSAFVLVQLPGFEAPIQSDYWVLSYRMLSTAQGLSYKQKDALEVVGAGLSPAMDIWCYLGNGLYLFSKM